jgi:tetratricopeptide (TPR) repeat protein
MLDFATAMRRRSPSTKRQKLPAAQARRVAGLWRNEVRRALALEAAGDVEGAMAAFARAHAFAPDEAEPAYVLATRQQRQGRLDEAERLYRAALAARPRWHMAAIKLARLIVEREQPTAKAARAEARRILKQARNPRPGAGVLQVIEAELLLDEERVDEARTLLAEVHANGFRAPIWNRMMARAENVAAIALCRDGRHHEALFMFKRACDLDARWAPPRANLGALWQRLGKSQQAIDQYRRALALDRRHGLAAFNLGLLLRARGDFDGATEALALALAADPPHPKARVELAMTLSDCGDHLRAIVLFEEELRHRPEAPAVHTHLGVACMNGGDPARAESSFRRALALDGEFGPALRNLAALYAEAGRWIDAAALVRRFKEVGNSSAPPASK